MVLFVWEFLPTFIVVVFFRVQRPNNSDVSCLFIDLDGGNLIEAGVYKASFFYRASLHRFICGQLNKSGGL